MQVSLVNFVVIGGGKLVGIGQGDDQGTGQFLAFYGGKKAFEASPTGSTPFRDFAAWLGVFLGLRRAFPWYMDFD
ncbi:hypothetical protein GCM10023213_31810 [Prosthecobacter algae]|uniref:Uncharacterized protein n=1 Tax=Prosthecobacter algae TaxID=1144682 RepID=A0ABP9PAR4_9BACT